MVGLSAALKDAVRRAAAEQEKQDKEPDTLV
jgi:hypothetical protein